MLASGIFAERISCSSVLVELVPMRHCGFLSRSVRLLLAKTISTLFRCRRMADLAPRASCVDKAA